MVRWRDDYRGEWRLDWRGKEPSNEVPPYGPEPVATFVLGLEQGYKVKHRWPFDLQKFQSGKARRISRNDAPQESYSGSAILMGDQPRSVRAKLARFAALGSVFNLALPHEALTIAAPPSGPLVFVHPAALAQVDWAMPGQRIVGATRDADGFLQWTEAVIQSVGVDSLEVSPELGFNGVVGGQVMPVRPIFLEPQQTFARYRTVAEVWQLEARAANFDFAPELAKLGLGPITASAGLDDVFVVSRSFSLTAVSFAMLAYAGDPAGLYTGFPVPTFFFVPGATTIGDLATALAGSPVVRLAGDYNPADTIEAGDAFGSTPLTGGEAAGTQGRGATLTEYDGDGTSRPVWNRRLRVATTAADSVQAMTQILDHGALPYAIGTADEPDWGRAIRFTQDSPYDWQWLKLFFATTLGPQNAFWLPTWRPDLTPLSYAPGALGFVDIDISTEDGSDFDAWWPQQRQHIQIVLDTGEVEYVEIVDAVDNSDGTRTISVPLAALDGTIASISWLELCRFEKRDFEFVFGPSGVSLDTTARVVKQ